MPYGNICCTYHQLKYWSTNRSKTKQEPHKRAYLSENGGLGKKKSEWAKSRKGQDRKNRTRQKNKTGAIDKWDQTGSPEIPDRGETSEIPGLPSVGCELTVRPLIGWWLNVWRMFLWVFFSCLALFFFLFFPLIISFCTSEIPGLPSGVAKKKKLERNTICDVVLVTMNEISQQLCMDLFSLHNNLWSIYS